MEFEGSRENTNNSNVGRQQQVQPNQAGRPPPIVLTTKTNLILLQKQLKELEKGNFEFHNTRNGTRIVIKEMADFSAIRSYFDDQRMSYFTFYPKSQKPVKSVIHHLLHSTPAEDIYDGLMNLSFDVISVKQMTTNRRPSVEGTIIINLTFFLIRLSRTTKSEDIFTLSNLCHIAIKVKPYKAQNVLTQCYKWQKFGHVWANCKQHPRCLWCRPNHLHKDYPEKENLSLTPKFAFNQDLT
jgi:hypothetical protein